MSRVSCCFVTHSVVFLQRETVFCHILIAVHAFIGFRSCAHASSSASPGQLAACAAAFHTTNRRQTKTRRKRKSSSSARRMAAKVAQRSTCLLALNYCCTADSI